MRKLPCPPSARAYLAAPPITGQPLHWARVPVVVVVLASSLHESLEIQLNPHAGAREGPTGVRYDVMPTRLLAAKVSPAQFRREHPSTMTNADEYGDTFVAVIENTEDYQQNYEHEARESSIVAAESIIAIVKNLVPTGAALAPTLRCHHSLL